MIGTSVTEELSFNTIPKGKNLSATAIGKVKTTGGQSSNFKDRLFRTYTKFFDTFLTPLIYTCTCRFQGVNISFLENLRT